jgi:uncharacterized protein (DUF2267 family)
MPVELTQLVRLQGRLATEELADAAIRAALVTLAERIPDGFAGTLAAQLPRELAKHLRRPNRAVPESDDFVARLAERTGLDAPRAARIARLVFRAVDRETDGALAVRADTALPEDVGSLVRSATPPPRRARLARAS